MVRGHGIAVLVIVTVTVLQFTYSVIGGHIVVLILADAVIVFLAAWVLRNRLKSLRRDRRPLSRLGGR